MVVAQRGRSLLLPFLLVSAACQELSLQRTRESSAADTTPPPADPPKRSSRAAAGGNRTAPAVEAAGFSQIRRALRRLVAAEATFFAENGTYTDDLAHIGFKPDPNTTVRFLWISRDGWAASGTHDDIPGRDCIIFVGQARRPPTTLKYVRSGREGTPVCDESRTPARTRPAPAAGQHTQPESAPPDTGNTLDLLDPRVVMKVDLRNLARSQETFFAMQGFYARRTESMALQYLWHRDVQVKIIEADRQSWGAKATHARFPGKSCVIWFGPVTHRPKTDAQRRVEHRSGVPVCDD